VLEHHADAGVDASVGLRRVRVCPLTAMVPSSGCWTPVEDLHQRRLAGAVLADDGVDGAASDGDLDVLVRDDTGKRLVMPCSSTAGAGPPLGAAGRSFTVESVMASS
jgi:hypothetical protein